MNLVGFSFLRVLSCDEQVGRFLLTSLFLQGEDEGEIRLKEKVWITSVSQGLNHRMRSGAAAIR